MLKKHSLTRSTSRTSAHECFEGASAAESRSLRITIGSRPFPQLYDKTLKDIAFLDDNPIQAVRKRYLKAILRRAYMHPLSRLFAAITLHTLQVPRITRMPRNLRLLARYPEGTVIGPFRVSWKSVAR